MDSFMLHVAETWQYFSISSCLWAKSQHRLNSSQQQVYHLSFYGSGLQKWLQWVCCTGPLTAVFPCPLSRVLFWTRGKPTFTFIAAVSGIWFLVIIGLAHGIMLLSVTGRHRQVLEADPLLHNLRDKAWSLHPYHRDLNFPDITSNLIKPEARVRGSWSRKTMAWSLT